MGAARRLRLMLTGLSAALASVFLFDLLIDPRGAWWQVHPVPTLYRRVRDERVMTPYLLRTAAPETLLLGSSRVAYGMKIEQGIRGGFENAALAGSRLVEISRELDIALRNPHLKRIIWGVEFYTFDSLGDRADADTMARLDGDLRIKLADNLLSYDEFVASYRLLFRSLAGSVSEEATMPIPWPASFICYKFAHPDPPTLAELDAAQRFREVSDLPEYRRFNYSSRLRQSFVDIVERIRAAHIELIAFIAPVTEYELEMIRQTGRWSDFQQWKRDVAEQVSYTDFSGYNGIARSDRMFMDAWHMLPAVGETIMRVMLGLPLPDCPDAAIVASSALRVTASDVDTILGLQDQRRDAAIATPNLYSTTVAAAIVKRYGNILGPEVKNRVGKSKAGTSG
jgi:hypothetical protein